MHPLLNDPWVVAQVDAAVAPLRGSLSEDEVAFLREQLAEILASDPEAQRLLRRARPRYVEESGEVGIQGVVEVPPRRHTGAGE
jgi:hypothetical protein